MIIGDLTHEIVLISIILKCLFLIIVTYELMLPRMNPLSTFPIHSGSQLKPDFQSNSDSPSNSYSSSQPDSLSLSWTTDLSTELQHFAITGNSFLFSIGLLLGLDFIARDDSWMPFFATIVFDLLLLILILALLYSPKTYGLTKEGIYHQGLILKWKDIEKVDDTSARLKITTKGWYRENPMYPLPKDREMRMDIVELIVKTLDDPKTVKNEDPLFDPEAEKKDELSTKSLNVENDDGSIDPRIDRGDDNSSTDDQNV